MVLRKLRFEVGSRRLHVKMTTHYYDNLTDSSVWINPARAQVLYFEQPDFTPELAFYYTEA